MKWTICLLVLTMLCRYSVGEVDDNSTTAVVTTEGTTANPFKEVEKQLKTSIGKGIKMLLPHLMRGSSDSDVSGQCTASIMKIISGVRQLKEWAVRCELLLLVYLSLLLLAIVRCLSFFSSRPYTRLPLNRMVNLRPLGMGWFIKTRSGIQTLIFSNLL